MVWMWEKVYLKQLTIAPLQTHSNTHTHTHEMIHNIPLIIHVPARHCAWMHRICLTRGQTFTVKLSRRNKNYLPSLVFFESISSVGAVHAGSIYERLHTSERRPLLRAPHPGCPAAARPDINT